MKKLETAKRFAAKTMVKAAQRSAIFTGTSTCIWWQYQPKEPKALKALKNQSK